MKEADDSATGTEVTDRDAIRTLVHSMNWFADEGKIDELLACFTEELVYDVGSFGTFHGRAELRKFYETTVAAFTMRIHHATNQVVEVNGNQAKSRCYWRAELLFNGRALISSGHYLDDLVKRENVWKVSRRTATITYMCPLDEGWGKTRMMQLG